MCPRVQEGDDTASCGIAGLRLKKTQIVDGN
jgi:hypothetical protein